MGSTTETKDPQELCAIARSIVDSNRFMTLATADGDGRPWASPVWYAPDGYREFLWVSSPGSTHSRNIETRAEVAIVIFDSHLTGGWNALYMSAAAERLDEVDEAVEILSRRSVEQGFPVWTPEDVLAPAHHRLYRSTATEHFVLDPHDRRLPVDPT
jgi:nitroimidazol reductase NimA-like FMN-containing flavoprotein (pyridoxamine 5'-phosphate oxidase superfamily)